MVQQEVAGVGEVVDVQELAPGLPGSPTRHLLDTVPNRLVEPTNHGGQDMAMLQIEVIARAVEIGRHRADVGSIVLSADRDELGNAGELCDREACVRLFEWPGEQCILADRLLGELRVDASSNPGTETVRRRWPRRCRAD